MQERGGGFVSGNQLHYPEQNCFPLVCRQSFASAGRKRHFQRSVKFITFLSTIQIFIGLDYVISVSLKKTSFKVLAS